MLVVPLGEATSAVVEVLDVISGGAGESTDPPSGAAPSAAEVLEYSSGVEGTTGAGLRWVSPAGASSMVSAEGVLGTSRHWWHSQPSSCDGATAEKAFFSSSDGVITCMVSAA